MPTAPVLCRRIAATAAAVFALAALAWLWSDAGPGGVTSVPVSVPASGGSAPAVPAVAGWTPVLAGAGLDGGLRIFHSDETPAAAAVRASRAFRSAGWEVLPSSAPDGVGRYVQVFRAGGAICWVMVEPDPRTGRTRCAVSGP